MITRPQGQYVITGATGLMGSFALLRLSRETDIKVRAVWHEKEPWIFSENIEYVRADLTRSEDAQRVVQNMEYLLMFAGELSTAAVISKNPVRPVMESLKINVNVLEAAHEAGIKKCLWLSSHTGYPQHQGPLSEEDFFKEEPAEIH